MIVWDWILGRLRLGDSGGDGGGDMLKSIYDTNDDGSVDNSEALGGQLPSYYLNRNNHNGTQNSSTISDFDSAVENNTQVSQNTNHRGLQNNPHNVTKAQVGLGNVDNTSDADKPISDATLSALNDKQSTLVSGINIRTVNGQSLLGSGDLEVEAVVPQQIRLIPLNFLQVTSGTSFTLTVSSNDRIQRDVLGNNATNISYAEFVLPDDFVSFPAGAFNIDNRRNRSTASVLVTLGSNGVPDANIDLLDVSNPNTDNTWGTQSADIGSNYSPNQRLLLRVETSSGTGGQGGSAGIGLIKIKYLSKA